MNAAAIDGYTGNGTQCTSI